MAPSASPTIDPAPPIADTALPWDRELADPVAALAAARATCGDTFVVDGPEQRTLFLFSPEGVRSFYALPEAEASKGVADWLMLRRKLPDELFDGRRTMPHELFGRDDVRTYLAQLDAAIDVAFDELGDNGVLDVFAFSRRLGHRMGLASWAGEAPSRAPRFDELVAALDELDGSAAFVHPEAMAAVAASGKRAERAAMATVETLVSTTIRARDAQPADRRTDDLFGRIVGHWDEVEEPDRTTGIARDVILVHLASMSNLFAASGWMLGHLVLHPDGRRPGAGRRRRAPGAVRARVDAHRAALGDAAGRPAADDGARRAHHLPGGARRADRDPAAADQHDRAARPRPLRPRSLGPPPARGGRVAAGARAGHDLRPR